MIIKLSYEIYIFKSNIKIEYHLTSYILSQTVLHSSRLMVIFQNSRDTRDYTGNYKKTIIHFQKLKSTFCKDSKWFLKKSQKVTIYIKTVAQLRVLWKKHSSTPPHCCAFSGRWTTCKASVWHWKDQGVKQVSEDKSDQFFMLQCGTPQLQIQGGGQWKCQA